MVYQGTLLTRWLPVSAMYNLPTGSVEMPLGWHSFCGLCNATVTRVACRSVPDDGRDDSEDSGYLSNDICGCGWET